MLAQLLRQVFLMAFFFITPYFAIDTEQKKLESSMPVLLTKIEAIVQKLANTNKTVTDVAHALGNIQAEQNEELMVHIGMPPFASARVSKYHEVIDVDVEFSAGVWRLRDITENPEDWSVPPLMPDTGEMAVFRDWDWEHVSIRCSSGVKGDGAIGELVLQYLNCQITPL